MGEKNGSQAQTGIHPDQSTSSVTGSFWQRALMAFGKNKVDRQHNVPHRSMFSGSAAKIEHHVSVLNLANQIG
jgi:hypothetical protein